MSAYHMAKKPIRGSSCVSETSGIEYLLASQLYQRGEVTTKPCGPVRQDTLTLFPSERRLPRPDKGRFRQTTQSFCHAPPVVLDHPGAIHPFLGGQDLSVTDPCRVLPHLLPSRLHHDLLGPIASA